MEQNKHWGKSLSIDLHACNHAKLTDPSVIKEYVTKIIEVIAMVAHGPCYIERFGNGQLQGYSAMQFIETSSITVHCDEVGNRAFIDIFSCKDFDEKKAVEFSTKFFEAQKSISASLNR